jgi:hypothetical protein
VLEGEKSTESARKRLRFRDKNLAKGRDGGICFGGHFEGVVNKEGLRWK